jgi:SAM-dependent methyltransferase
MTAVKSSLLPVLYQSEQIQGWSAGMRAINHALLANLSVKTGALLELGCGAGGFSAELAARYASCQVWGVDLHALALAYAQPQSAAVHFAQADLHQLPFPAEQFAAVLAFDTLDQQEVNLFDALAESWRVLRPRGMLLVRVSAHPWLQGQHDQAFHTQQRFARAQLVEQLRANGFDLVRITYANAILALPIILLRLLQRWQWLPLTPQLYTSFWLNRLLAWALVREAHWLVQHNLPFGVSLYALARKVG